MSHRLYNPWQITNDGEREADRHLALPVEMAGEIVYVLHSLRISSRYHRVQMSGECDFVVITGGLKHNFAHELHLRILSLYKPLNNRNIIN